MDVKLQRTIREHEVEQIIPFLPRSGTILEIGAGAGWQAKRIAEHGFDVKAIDLPVRGLAKYSEFDIIHYDGYNIPFPSECFSAVYASNVLDHIPHVYEFQKEIHRVLEPDGVAIIVLPTTSWRFWSILTHYPHYLKQAGLLIEQALMPKKWEMKRARVEILTNTTKGHVMGFLNTILLVPRLGERGNSVTELFLFNSSHRRTFFLENGWSITHRHPNKLFYTGYKLLGSLLSLKARHTLSRILGSSSTVYVVRKMAAQ